MTASPRRKGKQESAIMVDSSPVEIEPHVEDDDDDDDENDEEGGETKSGFSIPVVGVLWLVAVLAIIISLLTRPLIMIGCLVGVNIIFPVIYFLQWFRKNRSRNYQMLTQDESDFQVKISMASV
eukprot:CAMPEP_0119004974 /NCGR_PEP_ID=MMETSP1176-20130426/1458_1 /TAXON_ID=265551 /ORGANISM="Synedropsis recta cf, Strain CCMP1620" /LENGTH=123 /DNA_ID=CAMNT_0006956735 /DNA_START=49 /DNA_END=420 /DNA_ORIENTATION=+